MLLETSATRGASKPGGVTLSAEDRNEQNTSTDEMCESDDERKLPKPEAYTT